MSDIDEALEALRRLVDGDIPSTSALDRYERTIRQTLERQRVPSPDPRQRDGGLSEKQYRLRSPPYKYAAAPEADDG